jgi:hypothetical protein
MGYGKTAYNRTVYASPPVGGSGFVLARSLRYASFPRQNSATFLQPWSCYASPYSGCKNVVNSRNVRRNATLNFVEKIVDKIDQCMVNNMKFCFL